MPTPTKGPRLGGGPAHERLILANLASALFEHGRIKTTEAKAKRLRPLAEKLITKAKKGQAKYHEGDPAGSVHYQRLVAKVVHDKQIVYRLFTEIAPLMENRNGGYTRITKLGPRKGDSAPMAVIELVDEPITASATTAKPAAAPATGGAADEATAESAADTAEEPADEDAAASTDAEAGDAKASDGAAD